MQTDIQQVVAQFYPKHQWVSPLTEEGISWDYDPKNEKLKMLLEALKAIDPTLQLGTQGDYVVGEDVVLFEHVRLWVSYLGPYAALEVFDGGAGPEVLREAKSRVLAVLEKHGLRVLDERELAEAATWFHGPAVTVKQSLFGASYES